jgi:hypothetical protein
LILGAFPGCEFILRSFTNEIFLSVGKKVTVFLLPMQQLWVSFLKFCVFTQYYIEDAVLIKPTIDLPSSVIGAFAILRSPHSDSPLEVRRTLTLLPTSAAGIGNILQKPR